MKSVSVIVLIFALTANIRAAVTLDIDSEGSVFRRSDPALESFGKRGKSFHASRAILAFEAGDYVSAVSIARTIAASGDVDGIYLMGLAYETGKGVPQLLEKALEYYEQGAARGHAESVYKLTSLLMASEKEADVARAREMLEKQAAKDPKVAGRMLGEAFLEGRFTGEPAPDSAIECWKKSAGAGDVPSMKLLAGFYDGQMGFSEQRDAAQAVEFYRAAAEQGDAGAMVSLATKLLGGEEDLRDEKKGREWIIKAIATVDPGGYLALAKLQNAGDVIQQNKELAWALGKIAEERGEADAGDFVAQVEGTLSEEQLTSAKKELESLKSGEIGD